MENIHGKHIKNQPFNIFLWAIVISLYCSCSPNREYLIKICTLEPDVKCLEGVKRINIVDNIVYWNLIIYTDSKQGTNKSILLEKVSDETIFFIKWGNLIEIACDCNMIDYNINDNIQVLDNKTKPPYIGTSKNFTLYSLRDFKIQD